MENPKTIDEILSKLTYWTANGLKFDPDRDFTFDQAKAQLRELIEQAKQQARVDELTQLKEDYLKFLPPGSSRDFILIPSLDDRIADIRKAFGQPEQEEQT